MFLFCVLMLATNSSRFKVRILDIPWCFWNFPQAVCIPVCIPHPQRERPAAPFVYAYPCATRAPMPATD